MTKRDVVEVATAAQRLGFSDWKTEAAHKRVKRAVADPRCVLDGYQTRPGGKWWIYADSIAEHLQQSDQSSRDQQSDSTDTVDTADGFHGERCA